MKVEVVVVHGARPRPRGLRAVRRRLGAVGLLAGPLALRPESAPSVLGGRPGGRGPGAGSKSHVSPASRGAIRTPEPKVSTKSPSYRPDHCPVCSQSLKGVSGNLIILEEVRSSRLPHLHNLTLCARAKAAYCDSGLVSEVIVPLLSMQESVLLCISTLLDGSNHYSKMFELNGEDGQPLFKQIAITLVCDDCKRTDHPEKCAPPTPTSAFRTSALTVASLRRHAQTGLASEMDQQPESGGGSDLAFRRPRDAPKRDTRSLRRRVDESLPQRRRRGVLQRRSLPPHLQSTANARQSGDFRTHPPIPPFPRRQFPCLAVRVFRGGGSIGGWTVCVFNLLNFTHEGESDTGRAARKSPPPHMLITTLVATTSRSGFCMNALT